MNISDYYKESEFKKIYNKLILSDKGNKIIIFYLPSCKNCEKIIKIWNDLSERFNYTFNFYAVNCYDFDNDNDLVCNKFKIKNYPNIKYYLDNKNKIYEYDGLLNRDDLFYFLCKYI